MKAFILAALLTIGMGYSQTGDDVWYSFEEEQEESLRGYLRGFKDSAGNVMIAPKFTGFTMALKFDKIIAATEETGDSWKDYYLLKDGRQFGKDSLFVFDFGFDCESEGFIKFQDYKNDKVGMFGSNGKVAIPAMYNAMSGFKNGVAVALKGAEKVHMNHNHSDCDHWYWGGGMHYLINTKNEVLIENFKPDEAIDYYSMVVSATETTDDTRVSFKGVNGQYYSFIDNEKLFEEFIKEEILAQLTQDNLIAHSYPEIIYWENGDGWISKDKAKVINANFKHIAKIFSDMTGKDMEYTISIQDHIVCPDAMQPQFDRYKGNCGGLDTIRYPYMELYIRRKKDYESQKSFGFLKTEDGFKLLSVSFGPDLE